MFPSHDPDYLADHPSARIREYGDYVGVTHRTARQYMSSIYMEYGLHLDKARHDKAYHQTKRLRLYHKLGWYNPTLDLLK